MRRRASEPTANDADRHALASDLLHLADTLIQRGEMHKARAAIDENLALQRALQVNAPDNIRYAREISVSLMWLSDVLDALGQFAEAHRASHFQQSRIGIQPVHPAGATPDLLAARKTVTHDSWSPVTKPLALFEPRDGVPMKGASAAQAHALERAQLGAERLCRDFGSGSLYRYRSARPIAESWSCAKQGAGVTCGFEGHAECALDERHPLESETCG